MKLSEDPSGKINLIRAYGEGEITVNETRLRANVIVTPERLIHDWAPADFAAWEAVHLAPLVEMSLEIVLLGTGSRQRFPDTSLLIPLYEAGVGVEIMATDAACRTYNILAAEDRRVAAALLLEA